MIDRDPLVRTLDEIVRTEAQRAGVMEILDRVGRQLRDTGALMAWDTLPCDIFGAGLPASIRSCWIFVIRPGAATSAERHPNSHQRSLSLAGSGTFEVRDGADWRAHALSSAAEHAPLEQRWVSIPPSTWHRLVVGGNPWGMLSFHTVPAAELIEEKPVDAEALDGETHQERYAGR